jgi:hypothetical protein
VGEGERGPVRWTCCWLLLLAKRVLAVPSPIGVRVNSKKSTAPAGGCGLAGPVGQGPGRYLKFLIRIC